ncbi:MAG: hypothetical protein AB1750_10360 [Chloroflexota bacterium]
MSGADLMKLFDFNESDLNENRHGRLSDKQKTRLEQAEKSSKGCSSILGWFLVGIGLIGVGIVVSVVPSLWPAERGAAIWLIIGFGMIWPLVWGGLGVSSIRRSFAKVEIKVTTAEGPVNIVKVVRDNYNPSTKMHSEEEVYEFHVGRKTFEVDSELADVVMQGDVYAVYYADYNVEDTEDEILSAELLKKGK